MTDDKDDEDVKRRRAREDRAAMTVFVIAFLFLAMIALVYVSDIFSPGPSGEAMRIMGMPTHDPSINLYHEEGVPEVTATGTVTAIVPRDDKMPSDNVQTNYYARTEYYLSEAGSNCYFHHFLGPELPAPYRPNQIVTVAYQPMAADSCGSSRIVE